MMAEPVQKKSVAWQKPTVAPPIVHEVVASPGQTKAGVTGAFMEPRTEHDIATMAVEWPMADCVPTGSCLSNVISLYSSPNQASHGADLSYELQDAPQGESAIIRVQKWLLKYKDAIVEAESQFKIDRRAIAGAIAWEAIENNNRTNNMAMSVGMGRAVGPGKVHVRRERMNLITGGGEDTAAKQAEDRGYLDHVEFAKRVELLKTPEGAVKYIAGIMAGIADIARPIQDIRFRPDLLTDIYQSRDLEQWQAHVRSKKSGEPFRVGNDMGRWVAANVAALELAVGKPPETRVFDPMQIENIIKSMADADHQNGPIIQRSATTARENHVPPVVHEALDSPGQPLDAQTRAFMEPRLGHDFGGVRIHTDAKAEAAANAVNAQAFASGSHVAFATGQYRPTDTAGKILLAHELTHVIQHTNNPVMSSRVTEVLSPDSPAEREANEASEGLFKGRRPTASRNLVAGLARQQVSPEITPFNEQLSQDVQPGDVVVRSGTFSGKNPLVMIIGEPYNHGGIAINGQQIHHVESNGYETVPKQIFFDPSNASGGAVIRFQGTHASLIRGRVVDIVKSQRYKRITGNPFSTADDLRTVNCNEFTHEVFRQAIAELMAIAQANDPQMFQALLAEYGDPAHAGQAKQLIAPKTVEFDTGGMTTRTAVNIAELAGSISVNKDAAARGEVKIEFEGNIQTRNLYPVEWMTSWNPFKAHMYSEGFYTVAVLRTYTPDSFINSKYFQIVRRVIPGEK